MSRRVLVVDDNPIDRSVINFAIKNQYEVIETDSGQHAISILHQKRSIISAVIINLALSRENGIATIKEMRKDYLLSLIPIVAISTETDRLAFENALSSGANNLVTKPINAFILLQVLKNLINLRENAAMVNMLSRDSLTSLYNREAFLKDSDFRIKTKARGFYALTCIDIVNFKIINEHYSPQIANEVLTHIASVLKELSNQVDGTCGRMGGDQFALLMPQSFLNSQVVGKALEEAVKINCLEKNIRLRIGHYIVDDFSISTSSMFDRAIMAQESIKGRYDTNVAVYDQNMMMKVLQEQQITTSMKQALEEHQFEPWFQPQFNHSTGAMIGSEALVRWVKDGICISPNEFIPVFENNGFIYELDCYVWESICKILRGWLDRGLDVLPVSVNVSRFDLFQPDFISIITGLIHTYRLPIHLFRLEITESAFAESTRTIIRVVNHLINLGFTIEIDDFGSGYSSLNTLKDVPAQILKLDMRFFENTSNQQRSGNIIESVIRMARWIGMSVIAEGVESIEQANYLQSLGCSFIQGFLYSKPLKLERYEELLTKVKKQSYINELETLETFDNSEFWNPESIETLIFNSYVGGAYVFEYKDGVTELLRRNEQYIHELGFLVESDVSLNETTLQSCLVEEDKSVYEDLLERAIRSKQELSCDLRAKSPSGLEYIKTTVRLIAANGNRYLFYGVIQNQTEQKLANQKTEQMASELDMIINHVGSGVSATVHENGKPRHLFTNQRFYELVGYTREKFKQVCPNGLFDCIYPDDYGRIKASYDRYSLQKDSIEIEFRIIKGDGSIAWMHASSNHCYIEGFKQDVSLTIFTDITHEIQSRVREKEVSLQLQSIMQNVQGGIMAAKLKEDGSLDVIFSNNGFYELYGYTKKQMYEEVPALINLVAESERTRVLETLREVVRTGKKSIIEYCCSHRDSGQIFIQSANSVYKNEKGEDILLSFQSDITLLRQTRNDSLMAMDRFTTVTNAMDTGITAVTSSGSHLKTIFINQRYYQLHNLDHRKEMTIEKFYSVVDPQDKQRVSEFLRSNEEGQIQYRVVLDENTERWIQADLRIISMFGIPTPVQVIVYSDVTLNIEATAQLEFLNQASRGILDQGDSNLAIDHLIHDLMDYFGSDRAYVIEIDHEHKLTSNTYECCKAGVKSQMDLLQDIPFSIFDFWFKSLIDEQFLSIESVKDLDGDAEPVKELLLKQDINSLLMTPLYKNGAITGFVGLDNPTRYINHRHRLTAIADYISILITRRDLSSQLEKEKLSNLEKQISLLDNLPTGAALYQYDGKELKVIHINRSYWVNVNRSPDQSSSSVFDMVLGADVPIIKQEIDSAIRQSRNIEINARIRYGKEGYKPFHIVGKYSRDNNGTYLLYTSYYPISEQSMSIQDMLPVALATMLDVSDHPAYVKDKDLRYLSICKSMAQLLGIQNPRDCVGRNSLLLHSKEENLIYSQRERQVLESGQANLNSINHLNRGFIPHLSIQFSTLRVALLAFTRSPMI